MFGQHIIMFLIVYIYASCTTFFNQGLFLWKKFFLKGIMNYELTLKTGMERKDLQNTETLMSGTL